MSIELKIKSKHLAEEAKIIRFEERKLLKNVKYNRQKHYFTGNNEAYNVYTDKNWSMYKSLNRHRVFDVRIENRATFLARAYLAEKPYKSVEHKRKDDRVFEVFVLPRLKAMIAKYGHHLTTEYREWDVKKSQYIATNKLRDDILQWAEFSK